MRFEENIHVPGLPDSAILLVEDNEEDTLLLRRAFRNAHIANRLVEVRDGQAAIQYLSGDADYADRARNPIPFLILLDQPELAGLIIVVLTGSDRVPDITRAHDLGANYYMVKPGDFDDLVEMVK